MIDYVDNDANHRQYYEECLKEVMHQRFDQLFGFDWTKSEIAKG